RGSPTHGLCSTADSNSCVAVSLSVSGCMRVTTCQYSAAAAASFLADSIALPWSKAGGMGMPVSAGSACKACSRRDNMCGILLGGLGGPGHKHAAQLLSNWRFCGYG